MSDVGTPPPGASDIVAAAGSRGRRAEGHLGNEGQAVELSLAEPLPTDLTMADLVEAQARRDPQAVAVTWGHRSLAYGELVARANQLARHLQSEGVGPEVPVGLLVERSLDLAVGTLGILAAGGTCVPLDPSYPPDRLAFMVADTAAPVLVTHQELVASVPPGPTRLVCLDADRSELDRRPSGPPARRLSADNLAYVFYTSGSTGRPKGVMLPHRGVVNNTLAAARCYGLSPEDRVLQFCSISFGVSVEELFATWAAGATVVLRPDHVPYLGPSWVDWLRSQNVSVLNLPTAYWQEWAQDLERTGRTVPESLRLVVVGGDRALASALNRWGRVGGDRARWINVFGSAEVSHLATAYEPDEELIAEGVEDDPPIGRAIANATLQVLDVAGEPVASGEVGELYVGGPGLARGYLNRPGLTAQRFVPDPFATVAGARLYRTGDLVRLGANGDISFVGRQDRQVKIRGFRVERDEVESALRSHPRVGQALVLVREDEPGDRRLVAYVTSVGAPTASRGELRRFLAARLPDYMVPVAFVTLQAFPLTANGKVDISALPPPGTGPGPRTSGPGPATATEHIVASVWAEVLGLDEVGVHDDFFDLGGHSLLATQVVARLQDALGWTVPLTAIFETPTVASLAASLERWERTPAPVPPLRPHGRPRGAPAPVSLAQEQMLAFETRASVPGLYNLTVRQRFRAPVAIEALRGALALVVERHESLRTCFSVDGGQAWQSVASAVPLRLALADLTAVPVRARQAELQRRIAEHDARPFDLATAPLLRACLFHLGGNTSELVVTFDHLVCDLTSAYLFLEEVMQAYDALSRGHRPQLAPVPLHYADFAVWQRRWMTEDRLAEQLDYWREVLGGAPLGPCVPFDRVPASPSRRVARRVLDLSPWAAPAVRELARRARASSFVVCAAAALALFSRTAGSTDIVLSTTTSGRQRQELDGVIGMFAGVGRIRASTAGDPTFETVVHRARDAVLGLFAHQDVPFLRVREAVFPDLPGPSDPVRLAAALPAELLYFHVASGRPAAGAGVVPGAGGLDQVFFRGQLHPLSLTFLDEGDRLSGWFSYKQDFYDDSTVARLHDGLASVLSAVTSDPLLRLSELPLAGARS